MSSCTRYNVCKSNTESSYVRRRILVVHMLLFSAYGPSTKLVISFDIAYLWAYSFAVMFMILNFDRMHLACFLFIKVFWERGWEIFDRIWSSGIDEAHVWWELGMWSERSEEPRELTSAFFGRRTVLHSSVFFE